MHSWLRQQYLLSFEMRLSDQIGIKGRSKWYPDDLRMQGRVVVTTEWEKSVPVIAEWEWCTLVTFKWESCVLMITEWERWPLNEKLFPSERRVGNVSTGDHLIRKVPGDHQVRKVHYYGDHQMRNAWPPSEKDAPWWQPSQKGLPWWPPSEKVVSYHHVRYTCHGNVSWWPPSDKGVSWWSLSVRLCPGDHRVRCVMLTDYKGVSWWPPSCVTGSWGSCVTGHHRVRKLCQSDRCARCVLMTTE